MSRPDATLAIAFGPFRLLPSQRLLLESDRPVRLGNRAVEILIALVERSGEIVSKDELKARVWPNTVVEEGNLKVHVSSLRKALGDGVGGQSLQGQLEALTGQITHMIQVLTPERPEQEGPSLADLLARILTQQSGMAALLRQINDALTRLAPAEAAAAHANTPANGAGRA